MNHTNSPKIGNSFVKGVLKVPIWAWMVILGALSIFGNYYRAISVSNLSIATMEMLSLSIDYTVYFVVVLVFSAFVYPVVVRLLSRLDYAVASRIYFRMTNYVPDYNLRRLSVPYNDFLKIVLFCYCIIEVFKGVFSMIALGMPYAIHLLSLPYNIIKIGCYVLGAFMIKPFIEDWQMKRTFLALGIPSAILLCFGLGL